MKKILNIILLAMLLICVSVFAFAAYDGEISSWQEVKITPTKGQLTVLRFVPEISGKYRFYSFGSTHTKGFVFDENMNELAQDECGGDESNFSVSINFEAGKIYFLGAENADTDCVASFEVTVELIEADSSHIHSYYVEITKEPTCEAEGERTLTCICGKNETQTIAPLGHSYKSKTTKATCTQKGETVYTCTICKSTKTEALAALGHSYGKEYVIDKEPTCTASGSKSLHCVRCDVHSQKTSIAALGHNYSAKFTIDKAATCTAQGKKSRHCTRCDKKTDITSIAATGHSYGDFITTKAASCTTKGEKTKTCTVCSAKTKESIDALGHKFSSKYTIDKKSSLDSSGKKSKHCTRCDKKTDTVTISKISSVKLSETELIYNGKSRIPTLTVKNGSGEKLKEGRDYSAQFPKSAKSIGTYNVVITFEGNYSGKKTLSFKILPADIGTVSATQSSTSVTLSWKAVGGSVKYRIYKYSSQTKEYTACASSDKTSVTIKNLKAGTDYTFAVKAYKTIGEKTYISQSFSKIKTATLPAAPSLSVKLSGNQVVLKWSAVSCSGYEIYMKKDSGEYSKIKTVSSYSQASYEKSSLKSGSIYYFKIRAYKNVSSNTYYSAYSNVIKVTVK